MAFALRAQAKPVNWARSVDALGTQVKFEEGSVALMGVFLGAEKGQWSTRVTIQLLPFAEVAAEAAKHVPMVACMDDPHAPVPLYAVKPDGSSMCFNVAVERIDDPSGATWSTGIPKTVSRFHRLLVPYTIKAQQIIMVNVKSNVDAVEKLSPIKLVNVTIDFWKGKVKGTRAWNGKWGLALHATGHLVTERTHAYAGWPATDALRALMPYEQQMLPTRAECQSDPQWQPEAYARLLPAEEPGADDVSAAAAAAGDATTAEESTGASTKSDMLAPVRIDVSSFITWPDYYVLPSEEYTLMGATDQAVGAVATKMPLWVLPGKQQGKPEDKKWNKPRFGGQLMLGLQLGRKLGSEMPEAYTVAADLRFYPEQFANAPSWFPPLMTAITHGTKDRPPVPFVLLASVLHKETLNDQHTSADVPDGLLVMRHSQAPLWRMREYVERYGIPVSEEAVLNGRFNKGLGKNRYVADKDSVDRWYEAAFDGKASVQEKALVRFEKLDNPDGCVLLDMLLDELPDPEKWPDGTRYYAMPLYEKGATVPLPRRADPDAPGSDKLPEAMRPWRCGLKSEDEGDAYVRAELVALGRIPGNNTQTLTEALAARPALIFPDQPNYKAEVGDYVASLPYFCFWAVKPAPAAASATVTQPSRRAPAVVAKPLPVQVPKRERDEEEENGENAAKRARTEVEDDEDDPIEVDFDG